MRLSSVKLTLLLAILATLAATAPAGAATPIESFNARPSSTAAGGHPDVSFNFLLQTRQTAPDPCGCKQDARTIETHLPPGLIGNPHATPRCTIAEFSSRECSPDTQVGISQDGFGFNPGPYPFGAFMAPIYNLTPPPNAPALFAFEAYGGSPIFITIAPRTESDYGIDATVYNINHVVPLRYSYNYFWGVPADPIHDMLRWGQGQATVALLGLKPYLCDAEGNLATDDPGTAYQGCAPAAHPELWGPIGAFPGIGGPGHIVSSSSPLIPFFQNPTTCGSTSFTTSLDILAYDGGHSHADSSYPATTDCDQLSFNPSQAIEPTTTAADSPSGAEFRLTVPQFESPAVPSPSELRAAKVTLPPGFALAPNLTNGKTICTAAEARLGVREEGAQCPENAKIGTLTVDTPVLPGPLPGAVYLSEPEPGAGATQYANSGGTGRHYGLLLAFDGFGIHVKVPGLVTPDPQTGQIVITFENLPQAPFADFNMHVFGSERGSLATPTKCGTYEVKSEWTPWDASLSEQTSRQFFTIDQGPDGRRCPGDQRPFAPGFQAASSNSTGGAHTSFWLNLAREDGEQNISGLSVTTPPGFSATLRGIPYCPQAAIDQLANSLYSGLSEIASQACPAGSQVGMVTAGAGTGTHPLYLPGKVYLAGPYKGAPLSFEVVIPAVSGPFDLGNVAVRAAIHVDPPTGQVTTVSDPLPQIFGGIPIRIRQVFVNLDRPDFALNPTDCNPLSIRADLAGDEGGQASPTTHFQVSNCASLPFAPKLSLKLTGGVRRRGHPAIHALLRTQPGEANPSAISATLPPNELLDNAHIRTVCTKGDFAKQACPDGALLGHAEVTTPLLDRPLQGPAYLRSSGGGLPDLALDLGGQFHIEAVARIDAVNGGLRTTFQTVPDVPLGTVSLDLLGGSKGLIQNSESLCGADQKAAVTMRGHNGKSISSKVPLQAVCGKKAGKRRHSKARAHERRSAGR